MKVLLLAGGYGTRMNSVSKTVPKALLNVGGRVVLDHLVDGLARVPKIDRMTLVTNARFHDQFVAWARGREDLADLEILNDGSQSNENRLGAIGDLKLALDQSANALREDDLLVTGTDNIFRFDISTLVDFFYKKRSDVITVTRETDPERLARSGVARLDAEGRVVEFVEKPERPASNLVCPPLYIFTPETLALVDVYSREGHSLDAPGRFLAWLHERTAVYGAVMEGGRFDIGCPETYREACDALGTSKSTD